VERVAFGSGAGVGAAVRRVSEGEGEPLGSLWAGFPFTFAGLTKVFLGSTFVRRAAQGLTARSFHPFLADQTRPRSTQTPELSATGATRRIQEAGACSR
jgi:hypothetical protein